MKGAGSSCGFRIVRRSQIVNCPPVILSARSQVASVKIVAVYLFPITAEYEKIHIEHVALIYQGKMRFCGNGDSCPLRRSKGNYKVYHLSFPLVRIIFILADAALEKDGRRYDEKDSMENIPFHK